MDDDPMLAAMEKLADLISKTPTIKWGTVTQSIPLRVRLDGDIDAEGNPVTVSAQTVKGSIPIGSRVVCVAQDRAVIVIES